MHEQSVSASEMREKFSDYLEAVDRGRVLVKKHGQDRAYLISATELRALEETVLILEDQSILRSIQGGLADEKAGRVRDAREVFKELDAEFDDEE